MQARPRTTDTRAATNGPASAGEAGPAGETLARLVALVEAQVGQLTAIHERLEALTERLDRLEADQERRIEKMHHGLRGLLRLTALDVAALPHPQRLLARRFRLYSQNDEDGLTLALLAAAGAGPDGWFVEIGSGVNGGNSGVLAADLGWRGLMLDADEARVIRSRRLLPIDGERVVRRVVWVTRGAVAGVLAEHGVPENLDFLSIDIDGNDYWIWEALGHLRPRVVVVEYNSLFGPDRAVVVPYDDDFSRRKTGRVYFGASLAAFCRLGARLGYRLVVCEPRGTNAFFVRDDLAPEIPAQAPPAAYHLLDKHERWREAHGDLFPYLAARGLPLIDLDAAPAAEDRADGRWLDA